MMIYDKISFFLSLISIVSLLTFMFLFVGLIHRFYLVKNSLKIIDVSFKKSKFFYLVFIVMAFSMVAGGGVKDYARDDFVRIFGEDAGKLFVRVNGSDLLGEERLEFIENSLDIFTYGYNLGASHPVTQYEISIMAEGQEVRTYFYGRDSSHSHRYWVSIKGIVTTPLGYVETQVFDGI